MKQKQQETNLNKVALIMNLDAIKNHMTISKSMVTIETEKDGVMVINVKDAYKTWNIDDIDAWKNDQGKFIKGRQVYKELEINGVKITLFLTITSRKKELLFATFCDTDMLVDKFYQVTLQLTNVWGVTNE